MLEAGARDSLLAAARALVAKDGTAKFSVKTLLAHTGMARKDFYQIFASKQALLDALVADGAKSLAMVAEIAAPEAMAVAANAPAPQPVPPTDAWLERRLRVFERALTIMEKRQEQVEQDWSRRLALLEERAVPAAAKSAAPIVEAAEPLDADAPKADAPETDAQVDVHPALPITRPVEPPVSEEEMAAFLANARAAAQRATEHPEPVSRRSLPRWALWATASLVLLLVCAGMALATISPLAARTGCCTSSSAVIHRHLLTDGHARLQALADSGNAGAQTVLALAYLRGRYGETDGAAARRWVQAAAMQGQPPAQYLLATLYQQGRGGAADPAQAMAWFKAAAAGGNLKAMHALGTAYVQGLGVPRDEAAAARWFEAAARRGYVDSAFDLAVMYERGLGVAQDRQAALEWYMVASRAGDREAGARADALTAELDSSQAMAAWRQAQSFGTEAPASAANMLPSL